MSNKTIALVFVLLALVAVLLVNLLMDAGGDENLFFEHEVEAKAGDGKYVNNKLKSEDSVDRPGVAGPDTAKDNPDPETETEKDLLKPEGIYLSGQVVDKKTKTPIKSFCLAVTQWTDDGPTPWEEVARQSIEHDEGLFQIVLSKGGRTRCHVKSIGHTAIRVTVQIPRDQGLSDQIFELDSGLSIAGRVVDSVTGLPVQGALVAPAEMPYSTNLVYRLLDTKLHDTHCITDAKGHFHLTGLCESSELPPWLDGEWQIAAVHPDYAEGVLRAFAHDDEEVLFKLEKGFCIHGKALDNASQPAANVLIVISGDHVPMPRPVLTKADGTYRTPPFLPGRVFMRAGPPPGRTTKTLDFSEEVKRVVLHDRDMEIDFGPCEEHVTWIGSLLNRAGEPVRRGHIEIKPATASTIDTLQNRVERIHPIDKEGRFQFHKLQTGTYNIEFHRSSWASDVNLGQVTFEHAGEVTQDLIIQGAEIRGVVIDREAGSPVSNARGWVGTSTLHRYYKSFSSPLDESGGFHLEGIPKGTYNLTVDVKGYPHRFIKGITVEENQVLDNVRLEVTHGGTVHLSVMGFEGETRTKFHMAMGHKDGELMNYGDQYIDLTGEWELTRKLESGGQVLTMDFDGIGLVTREFEIHVGQTTEIRICREDVEPFEGSVSVAGTLLYDDGTPCKDAQMVFYGYEVTGIDEAKRSIVVPVDAKGAFVANGFKPGRWMVSAALSRGGDPNFPDLVIPPNPTDPVPLHIELAQGVLSGTFFDMLTGKPFNENGPKWWTFLRDVKTNRTVCEIQGGHVGDRFEMRAIPEGEFVLIVSARGYDDYRSDKITVSRNQMRDLGNIYLTPAGLLILECKNQLGEPVKQVTLHHNGTPIFRWEREVLSPGKFKYFKLPTGSGTLLLSAEGYMEQEMNVNLTPGQVQEMDVVFQ